MKRPYTCPVCNGKGVVSADFYPDEEVEDGNCWIDCRACNGSGVLWRWDWDKAPFTEPYVHPPDYRPWSLCHHTHSGRLRTQAIIGRT